LRDRTFREEESRRGSCSGHSDPEWNGDRNPIEMLAINQEGTRPSHGKFSDRDEWS
jgi:hypothetical protein